jgi:hypothetical protein
VQMEWTQFVAPVIPDGCVQRQCARGRSLVWAFKGGGLRIVAARQSCQNGRNRSHKKRTANPYGWLHLFALPKSASPLSDTSGLAHDMQAFGYAIGRMPESGVQAGHICPERQYVRSALVLPGNPDEIHPSAWIRQRPMSKREQTGRS